MIVKVQMSLATTEKKPQVLVYNEDRSVTWQGDSTEDFVDLLDGETKGFFEAKIRTTDGFIEIDGPADWQDW